MRLDRPILTARVALVLSSGVLFTLFAVALPGAELAAAALDLAALVLIGLDYVRAPSPRALRVVRRLDPTLTVGSPTTVVLVVVAPPDAAAQVIRGWLREPVPGSAKVESTRHALDFSRRVELAYTLVPTERGPLELPSVTVRLLGPWGLCARQTTTPIASRSTVYPRLGGPRDGLAPAPHADEALRRVRQLRPEGREFDSLREYRPGDDRRTLDWKATARRGRPIVREHHPERNQHVLVLLDCGRHMAGSSQGRTKLDAAVDATVGLAVAAGEQGDLFGVLAFSASVKLALWPRKERDHGATVARLLAPIHADLDEPDYAGAIDRALAMIRRRTLLVIITDLLDPQGAGALVRRIPLVVPRHLPVVTSLVDIELHQRALEEPATTARALERFVASRLEAATAQVHLQLRRAGAQVVRAMPSRLARESVATYIDVKRRGLL